MITDKAEYVKELQKIVERHKKGLSTVLRQFGVAKEPTPLLLLAAYTKYGDPFALALDQLGIRLYDGYALATGTPKWKQLLENGKNLVHTALDVKKGFEKKTTTEAPPKKEQPDDKIIGLPKTIFWGIAVVVTLTVIYLLIAKK